MSDLLLRSVEAPKREDLPDLNVGDSITLFLRVGVGEKNERSQMIRGMIIRKNGSGNAASFTVRRIAVGGTGVEVTSLERPPRIERIEVHRGPHIRRAKLYFMRGRRGKAARLREKQQL